MGEQLRLLLRVLTSPGAAMSEILDRGSLLFASVSLLAVSLLLTWPSRALLSGFPFSFYTPLLVLAIVYVPGTLLLSKLAAGLRGGLGGVFQRDYSALLTCTAMAWSAANLPLIPARVLPPVLYGRLSMAAYAYFLFLMVLVVRTVFGTGTGAATVVVVFSPVSLAAAYFLWGPLHFILGWLASPFFLFYAYYYLGSEIGNLGAGLRRRQGFRRMLEAAAVNPHDAEAQYQLGLMYQERHRYTEAIGRFEKAIAIDPKETDAHFQLGRIAREQGRAGDALRHFQAVIDLDERHRQSEILRELGALYLAAGQFADARAELATYVERRPYDPEGLCRCGQALEGLGRTAEAREMYERTVEAVRTAPRYLQRAVAKWSRLAQKRLRS